MRRIVMAVMGTISGLALLFSYHTSTNQAGAAAAGATSASGGTGSGTGSGEPGTTSDSSSGSGSSSDSSAGSSSGSAVSGTFTGDSVQTRWGPVQVEITVQDGKVTGSRAVVYPQENHKDEEINGYALPILDEAAVQAQSANLDNISGATVTTQGYIQSLQSAIDQAFR
jgi:uncharacterized protein with FMN-binding domain